jgi:hypothetical protein
MKRTSGRLGMRAHGFLLAAVVALSVACGDDHGGLLGAIGVSLRIDDQTIPGFVQPAELQGACIVNVPGIDPISTDILTPISFNIKASDELQGQAAIGFAKVFIDKITLTIIPPSQSGQTWDFLDSIQLFASVAGSGDPPVLVAELDPVPRGLTTLVIPGKDVDISDIASHDEFQVTGKVSGRPPCADVHFDGSAKFDVSLF